MTWQVVVVLQIIVSSLLAIWVRHVSIKSRQYAFSVGFISYICIAVMGLLFSLLYYHALPPLPQGNVWLYLAMEGIFIPASWLFQFLLISHIGASNGVIASTLNALGAALLGLLLLHEPVSVSFVTGTALIIAGVLNALRIKPDEAHAITATLSTKILLLTGSLICFSIGMLFEKKAIGAIGVWNYAAYGWAMQFVGASVMYVIFGKKQLARLPKKIAKNAVLLGLLTSIAGLLYILALSKGTLSHTIVATSGKIAITMVLAAILLHERNNMTMRITAFGLATLGIFFIML